MAFSERRATKLVKLHSGAILFVDTIGDLLVTGAADGHVRFFDFEFRVVAWFEDLDAGPVTRVSFAHQPGALKGDGTPALRCPDFVVGTANSLIISCEPSMFEELRPEDRRGTLLVQGQDAAVVSSATPQPRHPHRLWRSRPDLHEEPSYGGLPMGAPYGRPSTPASRLSQLLLRLLL